MKLQSSTFENQSSSIPTILLGIWTHITFRRRIQLGCLLVVMLASGAAELLSLGSVLPFLALLSDPNWFWQHPLVQELFPRMGFTQANDLLLPATLVFVAAAIISAVVRLTNMWLNLRLAAAVGSDLSCESYMRTLYQPYQVHVQRNSAEVISSATVHISQTVAALNSLLQLITSAVVAVGLLTGLLLIDAPVAIAAAALFGSAYGALAITLRRELHANSHKIAEASTQRLKALQEGLGAIRDVLLEGNQLTYLEIYRQADRPQRQLQARNSFLGTFPRYSLEALGMVAIAVLGCLLVLQQGSGGAVIPLLGTLALGAQRLLPSLQQIYVGWSSLKSFSAAINRVLEILNQPLPFELSVFDPLTLNESIRMENVHFRYGQEQEYVIRGINFEIRSGERIGLVGSTGSGKSTTVDLLMGLLKPTQGRLMVNGLDLHDPEFPERLIAWRAAIAHVPQNIYLADSSIAENIAFGVHHENIDLERVKQAAAQAQIDSFIESMPECYESLVGERGIRLSGGQRQRIGIARALYKRAEVLIFDEATSALDAATEESLMSCINTLKKSVTIVMIAHRISTVMSCDRVIRLEKGIIKDDGPPTLVLAGQC